MTAVKFIQYMCPVCGTMYKDVRKAELCEKSHIKAEKIKFQKFHSSNDIRRAIRNYPDAVDIVHDILQIRRIRS